MNNTAKAVPAASGSTKIRNRRTVLPLLAAAVLLVACLLAIVIKPQIFGFAADVPPVNLAGRWSVSTAAGQNGRVMTLAQNGEALEGEVEGAGAVAGEVKGNRVKLWLQADNTTMGSGTAHGDLIEGAYSCTEEGAGKWQATRLREQDQAAE